MRHSSLSRDNDLPEWLNESAVFLTGRAEIELFRKTEYWWIICIYKSILINNKYKLYKLLIYMGNEERFYKNEHEVFF